MPTWTDRDTKRARELRNAATPAERALWRHLAKSQLGVRFGRQMPVGAFFADFLCRVRSLCQQIDRSTQHRGVIHAVGPVVWREARQQLVPGGRC